MSMQAKEISFNLRAFVGDEDRGVDARELHKQLEVGCDFSTWVKRRVEEAQLIEGQDFIRSSILGSAHKIEYVLSIDSAKHIAMLERNEIGRQVRQYFIEIEKRARQESSSDPILALLTVAKETRERQIAIEKEQAVNSNRIDHLEDLIDRDDKDISVIGWININSYPRLLKGEASQIGRILTKFAKAEDIEPSKVRDARYGYTNAYPRDFMEEYFDNAYERVLARRDD